MRAVYLQKCGPHFSIRSGLVQLPYGYGSTQTRRSMFSACRTFSAFNLRAGYGFTQVQVTRLPCTSTSAWRTASASIFLKNPIVTWSAWRARNKCTVRPWSVLIRHFLSSSRQNPGWPYLASTRSALITHGVRTTDQHPTAAKIKSRSPHLRGKRVRTPYALRTYNAQCAHWPTPNSGRNKLTLTVLARTYNGRASKNTVCEQRVQVLPSNVNMAIARCKHVVSTYHSLTIYVTYDTSTCNHLPLDVACGRRSHALRNRECEMLLLCSCHARPPKIHTVKTTHDTRRVVTLA